MPFSSKQSCRKAAFRCSSTTKADNRVSVDRGRGAASLRVEGNAKRYRYDLLPDGKGGLTAPVNLSQIAGRQIEIEIQLVGIDAAGGQPLTS